MVFCLYFLYCMRRAGCPRCDVKVEGLPWPAGKSPLTRSLALFLAGWAKALSWQEVAQRFRVNWHRVLDSARYAVERGLAHRDLSGVTAIGIDEVHFGKGQRHLTVAYPLRGDARRLLYVGQLRSGFS